MTANEYVVYVQLAGRELGVALGRPEAVDARAVPERVRVCLRCVACDSARELAGPVTFAYIDDDHYGHIDLAYEARLSSACPSCNAELAARLHLTLTRHGDGSASLICDSVER